MRQPDEAEYVEFVTGRLPQLRRLAHHLTGDWHRADDVLQTMLGHLYVRWKRVRAATDVDVYVRAMVVNAFLTEKRRAWSRVSLRPEPPEPSAVREADVAERVALRAALDAVPPRQRATLVLRFLYDLPVSEVARILGCTEGTVKSQTSHGLAAMRRLLDEPAPVGSGPAGPRKER